MFSLLLRLLLLYSALVMLLSCERASEPERSIELANRGLHAAALDDGGDFALAASINHGASLWRLEDGERLFDWNHQKDHYSTIIAADFDSTSKWVLSAEPNTMVLWNKQSGIGERFWTAPGEILDLALGPNARFALLGLDTHQAVIFDVLRGGIKQSFVHENRVRSVDLSADGSIAVTGSEDFSAHTWHVKSGAQMSSFQHDAEVQLVALSADGSLVLSASKYDKAVVWQSRNGKKMGEIALGAERIKRGVRFTAARFSEDKRYLLTGRPDQWVELWSLSNFQTVARWKVPKRKKWKPTSASILAVAFSKQKGEFIVIASNGLVHRLKQDNIR